MEEKQIKELVAGIFVVLAAIGVTYMVINPGITYYCEDTNTVGMCFKLSDDSDGLHKRCYYNESAPTKYKYCRTGWQPYKEPDVTGNETDLPTYVDVKPFELEKNWSRVADAENYINQIKQDVKSEVEVVRITQKTFSNEIEVHWKVTIYKESKAMVNRCFENNVTLESVCETIELPVKTIVHSETLTSKLPEDATNEEIDATVTKHATEYISRWQPTLTVEIAR